MTTYRKATLEEIQKFVKQNEWAKYIDNIDVKSICKGVREFFPPELSYIILECGDEYNDEGNDLKVRDILGYDKNNKELEKLFENDSLDEKAGQKLEDKYYDFKCDNGDLGSSTGSYDGQDDREFSIKINVDKQEVIPDSKQDIEFYVKS